MNKYNNSDYKFLKIKKQKKWETAFHQIKRNHNMLIPKLLLKRLSKVMISI